MDVPGTRYSMHEMKSEIPEVGKMNVHSEMREREREGEKDPERFSGLGIAPEESQSPVPFPPSRVLTIRYPFLDDIVLV